MSSKSGFSISDLQLGAKRLNHTDTGPSETKRSDDCKPSSGDIEALTKLGKLFSVVEDYISKTFHLHFNFHYAFICRFY